MLLCLVNSSFIVEEAIKCNSSLNEKKQVSDMWRNLFWSGRFEELINTYVWVNLVFGHTSPGLSKFRRGTYMISFCKTIWGAVSIGTVPDNKGIKDFIEDSIPGLEGSTNTLWQKEKGKQSKTKRVISQK